MQNDKIPYARESKSYGRRSSILKRQDSCLTSEASDGTTDFQRTPRRVSFASTAMVRYLHTVADESSSTTASCSDTSSGSSQSSEPDSVFIPDPTPSLQGRRKNESVLNSSLTEEFLSASPEDQPCVLVKAISTFLKDVEVDPSYCPEGSCVSEQNKTMYETMSMSMCDISGLSHSTLQQDGNDEMKIRCVSLRQLEAQNHTILFTDMDEDGCFMDITSKMPQLPESVLQRRDDSFYQDGYFRKGEHKNKPGLIRRPSFADEGTSEYTGDQIFMEMGINSDQGHVADSTIVFCNEAENGMEITQDLTKPRSGVPYPSRDVDDSITLKHPPRLVNDLFQLVKLQEPSHATVSNTNKDVSQGLSTSTDDQIFMEMGVNSYQGNVADHTIVFCNKTENGMEITQDLTKPRSGVPYPGRDVGDSTTLKHQNILSNDLIQLVKQHEPSSSTDCSTNKDVSQGVEDMEITGDFSQIIPRTALSDITTNKALTTHEDISLISTNISIADQENGTHLSNLNKVCSQNKENCLIPIVVCKSLIERQTVISVPDQHAKNVQFGISSKCSMVKENKSYGNKKVTECQTTSIYIGQKGSDDYEVNYPLVPNEKSDADIPVSGHEGDISVAVLNGRDINVQEKRCKPSTNKIHEETFTQAEDKEGLTLPRKAQDKEASILFGCSDDMKCTGNNTRTIYTGQDQPYGQEGRDSSMVFDKQISQYPVSLPSSHCYVYNSHVEITGSQSGAIFVGDTDSGRVQTCSENLVGESEDMANVITSFQSKIQENTNNRSHMEVTEGLSKTIYFVGTGNERPGEVIDSCSISRVDKDLNRFHMEVTEGLSKTIYFGGNGNERQGKAIYEGNKTYTESYDLNRSNMEVTGGLSKTIYIVGKGNERAGEAIESVSISKKDKDLNRSCMEVTGCLSKTIYIGGKGCECPGKTFYEGNKTYTESNDLNRSHLEVTEGLSKTIYIGGKGNDWSSKTFEAKQISEETYLEQSKDVINTHSITNPRSINVGDRSIQNRSSHIENSSQTSLTATECTVLATSDFIKRSERNVPMLLNISKSDVREFQMDNVGINQCSDGDKIFQGIVKPQQLGHHTRDVDNVRSSPNKWERTHELAATGNQRNTVQSTDISSQENTAVEEVDEKRKALRQALMKEIELPLSLLRSSATSDFQQRRRKCNFDLILGRNNKGHGKSNHIPANQEYISQTVSIMSTSGEFDKKHLPAVDLTGLNDDAFQAEESPFGLPSFIYEHTQTTPCSENADQQNTIDARLKSRSNIDRECQHTHLLTSECLDNSKGLSSRSVQLMTPPSSTAHEHAFAPDFELSEALSDQEMPDLTEETVDLKLVEESFEFKEDASFLSDLQIVSNMDQMFVDLQEMYKSLDVAILVPHLKNILLQDVATTTVKEKLIAKLHETSRLGCLKQHVSDIEATIKRSQQESAEKLMFFSNKPPPALVALQDKNCESEVKSKAQEMFHSCRISARAAWKQHKAGYLMKCTHAVKAACQALNREVGNVLSDTHKVLDLTTNVDKCLQEVDSLCGQKQELLKQQEDVQETERETQHLRTHCKELDERLMSLTKTNRESTELLRSTEAAKEDIAEKLSWINCLVEWTIVKQINNEIHFAFLFNTLIIQINFIDCDSHHQQISSISLHSRLSDKSKPWSKLVHHMAMSSIDCDTLQSLYKNSDQICELLAHVSAVVYDSRQLSAELKLAHLKHGLSIEDNRLRLTVSNRKTRRKVALNTTVALNSHPYYPLLWNVTTILGNIMSQDVKAVIDRIDIGPKYITRVLSQTERLLAQCQV